MRVVTLLTDFGSASPYPAQVHAVVRAGCRAVVVDITHDIAAHDIAAGAYALAAAAPAFATGTVHLAVVDPGVGSARRAVVVAAGGHLLVGPDNGLLVPAARALGAARAFVIDRARGAGPRPSATFHGRDLFAPVAAALAGGLPPERVGPPAGLLVERPEPAAARAGDALVGRIRYCDTFGNLVTNIPGAWLGELPVRLVVASAHGDAPARRVRAYSDGAAGELIVLVGSDGAVEIATNAERAADAVGLGPGDAVALRPEQAPPGVR